MTQRRGVRLIPIILSIVVIIGWLSSTSICGGGGRIVEPEYKITTVNELQPQIYRLGSSIRHSLFAVPQDNAVGTNDHDDAITIFSFPRGKLEIKNYFKGELDRIQGGGTYLPVISPDMVGFGKVRMFMLFNFKTRSYEEYRIVFPVEENITKIAIADAEKRRFIFEIKERKPGTNDPWDFTFSLQLIDLSDKKVNLITQIPIDTGSTWVKAYDKVFLWLFVKKKMYIYDSKLQPSQHELGDLINAQKDKLNFIVLIPHPFMPFAIMSGGKKGALTISWGENRSKEPKHLLNSASQFSFSPDGKWVAYQQGAMYEEKTYIMPVSEKYPNYLGTPIQLRNRGFGEDNFAWTKNPVSFVTSDGTIYRWELTNEAHPESDKPTFHDYIVEKDLERLAKEKKH